LLRLRFTQTLFALVLVALVAVPAALARVESSSVRTTVSNSVVELPEEPAEFRLTHVPAFGDLTSRYGPRWGRMHHGIDIGTLRKLGVVAAAGGTVTHTGYLPHYGGYGKVILVAHGEGRVTLYSHLSRIRVQPGDEVEAGAWIGNAGCTGVCTGTHLHFELRVDDVPVDPLPFFETQP